MSYPEFDQPRAEAAIRELLFAIGEDPDREGLVETPARVARAYKEACAGLHPDPTAVLEKTFNEDHQELVLVRDITFYSMCEHHLVPFRGKIHIGYVPNRLVIGLSKLARIAETFARRLSVQERLTRQVALALDEALKPRGVAVVMECEHMCMAMRGVQKPGANTVTSCMLGCFRERAKTREEFLSLIKR